MSNRPLNLPKIHIPGSVDTSGDIDYSIGLRDIKSATVLRRVVSESICCLSSGTATLAVEDPEEFASRTAMMSKKKGGATPPLVNARSSSVSDTGGSGYSPGAASTNTLRVATWNVWFGAERQEARMYEIMSIMERENVDIFCFQEVNLSLLQHIYRYLETNKHFSHYYISGASRQDIKEYGNVIFSKLPIHKVYFLDFTHHSISRMNRQLVCCDFLLSTPNSSSSSPSMVTTVSSGSNASQVSSHNSSHASSHGSHVVSTDTTNSGVSSGASTTTLPGGPGKTGVETLRVGNVHLESLDPNLRLRQLQLDLSYDFMCNTNLQWDEGVTNHCDHLMLMGDFNQCATINVAQGLSVPQELKDAWEECYSNRHSNADKTDKNMNESNEKNEKNVSDGSTAPVGAGPVESKGSVKTQTGPSEGKEVEKEKEKEKGKESSVGEYVNNFGKNVKRREGDPKLKNPGWTMPATKEFETWRPDRMMYAMNRNEKDGANWRLVGVKRVGMEPFPNSSAAREFSIKTPSDHYGLVAEFERFVN